jgi:hypothetical protein
MFKKMKAKILQLQAELQANKGIVPDSWKPYLELIKLLLVISELFEDADTRVIIQEIIAAISLAESA